MPTAGQVIIWPELMHIMTEKARIVLQRGKFAYHKNEME
jgi:hypothetical protein